MMMIIETEGEDRMNTSDNECDMRPTRRITPHDVAG